MYEQEKINPYEAGVEKTQQVEQMFDRIAPTYDKLNHRLSWDIDRGWRKKAIRQLMPLRPRPCSTSLPALVTSPSSQPACYSLNGWWVPTSARE